MKHRNKLDSLKGPFITTERGAGSLNLVQLLGEQTALIVFKCLKGSSSKRRSDKDDQPHFPLTKT